MAMNGELYSDFRIEQAGRQPLKDTTEKSKNRPFLQILLIKIGFFFWRSRVPLGPLKSPQGKKKFAKKNFRLERSRNLGGPKGVKTLIPPSSAKLGSGTVLLGMVNPSLYTFKMNRGWRGCVILTPPS